MRIDFDFTDCKTGEFPESKITFDGSVENVIKNLMMFCENDCDKVSRMAEFISDVSNDFDIADFQVQLILKTIESMKNKLK